MSTQTDILTQIAAIKAQVEAIVVPTGPLDEQPVTDALTDLQASITAKFPAPAA